jgi:hypothetical protein
MTVTETNLPAPFCTTYGVDLHCIGEDGEHLVAFGHIDKRRFFAACNHFARREWSMVNLADGRDATWADVEPDIRYEYARFATEPESSEYAWEVYWRPERDDEHRMPVTVWTATP